MDGKDDYWSKSRKNIPFRFGQLFQVRPDSSKTGLQSIRKWATEFNQCMSKSRPRKGRPWLWTQKHRRAGNAIRQSPRMSINNYLRTNTIKRRNLIKVTPISTSVISIKNTCENDALISRRWAIEKTGLSIFLCRRCCSPSHIKWA